MGLLCCVTRTSLGSWARKPMLDPIDVGTRADLQQKNLYDSHSTAKRSRKARLAMVSEAAQSGEDARIAAYARGIFAEGDVAGVVLAHRQPEHPPAAGPIDRGDCPEAGSGQFSWVKHLPPAFLIRLQSP